MESRGREIFHDYIDSIRKSEDLVLRKKTFCAQYFMRNISDIYDALNTKALMDIYNIPEIRYSHDTIIFSMMYCLIFFMYGLFEIVDRDFKHNPIKKIRNKIGHGKKEGEHFGPINSFTALSDEAFLNYEFSSLYRAEFSRGVEIENKMYLLWCFKKNNDNIFKVDGIEYQGISDAYRHLLSKLNNEQCYIDTTGNFVCDIDSFYNLSCEKTEEYLRKNFPN